ncbi:MAG: hypothetical protein I8H75_02035 [Myxococcaceae bacterium]|nr:hypothetical protein [Myxococcaceae bacterium]
MAEKKKIDPLQFDKRVMHRFVTNQKMTQKELQQHLQALPDLAQQADDISGRVYGDKKGHAA